MDNCMIITVDALQHGCIPENWTSFGNLCRQIEEIARAKPAGESPFWMLAYEEKQREAVIYAALLEVKKMRGHEVSSWVSAVIENMSDVERLPELMEHCPDKSMLPLIEPKERP